MEHLRVLNVEHVPLHAAGRGGRQACHVVLVLVPLCFGEEFACAQQIPVCQQILLSQASHQVELFDNLGRRICRCC